MTDESLFVEPVLFQAIVWDLIVPVSELKGSLRGRQDCMLSHKNLIACGHLILPLCDTDSWALIEQALLSIG